MIEGECAYVWVCMCVRVRVCLCVYVCTRSCVFISHSYVKHQNMCASRLWCIYIYTFKKSHLLGNHNQFTTKGGTASHTPCFPRCLHSPSILTPYQVAPNDMRPSFPPTPPRMDRNDKNVITKTSCKTNQQECLSNKTRPRLDRTPTYALLLMLGMMLRTRPPQHQPDESA